MVTIFGVGLPIIARDDPASLYLPYEQFEFLDRVVIHVGRVQVHPVKSAIREAGKKLQVVIDDDLGLSRFNCRPNATDGRARAFTVDLSPAAHSHVGPSRYHGSTTYSLSGLSHSTRRGVRWPLCTPSSAPTPPGGIREMRTSRRREFLYRSYASWTARSDERFGESFVWVAPYVRCPFFRSRFVSAGLELV